jgi:hypothetical protein
MAIYYKTSREVLTIRPANGKVFSMEELKGYVGGGVEILTMPDGRKIAVNEMGKFSGLEANTRASEELIGKPKHQWDFVIGDAVVGTAEELGED